MSIEDPAKNIESARPNGMPYKNWLVWAIVIAALANLAFAITTGLGFNPAGVRWDFDRSAALGNSFGPLSAVTTSIAAISAYLAYDAQKQELDSAKSEARLEKVARAKRDFEQTFFSMLDLFRSISDQIEIRINNNAQPIKGRLAIRRILREHLTRKFEENAEKSRAYRDFYHQFQDELGSYFRTFYLVLRYINESEMEEKPFYSRLLRSNLSTSAISLIALNCMYGGGREKLKPLVEKYSMLHNMSTTDYQNWNVGKFFHPKAFGDRDMSKPED